MEKSEKLKLIQDAIETYPNFPKPGIIFRDIFGILKNSKSFHALKDILIEYALLLDINMIFGLESRGFLLGPLISCELNKPFLAIRKKGKLPGKVIRQSYSLEYGEDELEVTAESLNGKKVLIVDDLIATGGSLSAAVKLLKNLGAETVECLVVIELVSLKGRENVDAPVHSIIKYD